MSKVKEEGKMRIRFSERTQKKVPKVNIERVACNLKRRTYQNRSSLQQADIEDQPSSGHHQIGKYIPPYY